MLYFHREIWALLRTPDSAALASGRRTEAAAGRVAADRAGGSPGHALRVGSGASFPGRVFAFERAGSFSGGRQPADQTDPAGPRNRAASTGLQSSGPGGR